MKRIIELDGLRGIAVLMVILFHYVNNQLLHSSGFGYFLAKATYLGWIGVDLFFVLSGFLIGSIIFNNIDSENFFSVFYRKRFFRIVPPYLLLLSTYYFLNQGIGVQSSFFDIHANVPFAHYVFFVQNISMGLSSDLGAPALSPTWSISIEEQFYLFYPLAFLLIGKRNIVPFLLAAIVCSIGMRFYYVDWIKSYVFFHSRLDGLSMGILIAALYTGKNWNHVVFLRRHLLPALIMITGVTIACFAYFRGLGAANHSLFSLLFSLVILIVLSKSNPWISALLGIRVFRELGKYSYFLYLFHYLILGLGHYLNGKDYIGISDSTDILVSLVAISITYVLATISFKYFETPMMSYGKRLKYRS